MAQNGTPYSAVRLRILAKEEDTVPSNESGSPWLYQACQQGDTIFATELLLLKANINVGYTGNIQQNKGCSPLMIATQLGHLDTVKILVAHKANINHQKQDGATALHAAAQSSHNFVHAQSAKVLAAAKYLLDARADVDLGRFEDDVSPLFAACDRGHPLMVCLVSAKLFSFVSIHVCMSGFLFQP